MNERIKEILFEAGGKYGGYNHLTGNDNIYTEDVDYEKFAELIVQEFAYDCIDVTGQGDRIQWIASKWGVKI